MESVDAYLNAHEIQYCDVLETIDEFGREMSEMRGTCIDIGCGPGNVTEQLIYPKLSPDAKLVGADISKSMIEHAKRKYRDKERLSFVHLDIETTNLPNKEVCKYDNVLSFYCLHWCQNTRQAFNNIHRLLRPGGKALIMFLAYNNGFDAYVRIRENPRYQKYMEDAHRYVPYFHRCEDSRAALREILEEIGFEILHCSKREKTFIFQNEKVLKNHALAVNPFISRVPDDMREEFGDVVVREIMSRKILFPNNNGNGQQEYSILDRYDLLVAYIKKPLNNDQVC